MMRRGLPAESAQLVLLSVLSGGHPIYLRTKDALAMPETNRDAILDQGEARCARLERAEESAGPFPDARICAVEVRPIMDSSGRRI